MKTTRKTTPITIPQPATTKAAPSAKGAAPADVQQTQKSAPAADAFDTKTGGGQGAGKPIPTGAAQNVATIALGNTMNPGDTAALEHILGPELAAAAKGAGSIAEALENTSDAALANLITERFTALEKTALQGTPERLTVGDHFVDIGRLVPGQTRISLQRVREKVAKQVDYDGFVVEGGKAKPAFAGGEATVPLDVLKTAVAAPGGRVLVTDGNHQAVASILAGATQVPIRIVADHQDLSKEAFAALAEKEGWLYLNDFGGAAPAGEASYKNLKDDPVRFLFTQVALKASMGDDGAVAFEDESRLSDRLWMKLDGITVDFVEFRLADVIYRAAERDPFLADVLETGSLSEKAKATRKALGAAVKAGEFAPAEMGIVLLTGDSPLADIRATAAAAFKADA